MIEFQTASKTYGQTEVLQGLTLAVEAGETVVLIGPSGGGKTTALKLVNGLVQPTGGTVLVDGRSVASW
ncbi:MAG: amino acid ABC transporter ATP-binding protein, partial [Candidatus Marinimicrobia bacterium]|nr:amino acid ABC transporter ATP-binding protein [Candidatus Neomarinimicrobiota bacterium]